MQQAHAANGEKSGPAPVDRGVDLQPTPRSHAADAAEMPKQSHLSGKDNNSLAVQMDHEGFGKLDIHLSLDKGAVNTQINVQDNAAKTLLENNRHQIMESLMKEGLNVGGFTVGLNQRGAGGFGAEYQRPAVRNSEPGARPVPAEPIHRSAQGLVNIFI